MKKSLLSLAFLALIGMGYSQITNQPLTIKPSLTPTGVKSTNAPVTTLAHCTDVTAGNANLGQALNGVTPMAYFPSSTMGTYTGNVINKISIGVYPGTLTGDVTIMIWADTSNFGSSPAYTQTVAASSLSDGWNDVILSTPYAIDGNELTVGYSANTSTGAGFGYDNSQLAASDMGSYFTLPMYSYRSYIGTGTAGQYLAFAIKAYVDDGASFQDVELLGLTGPDPECSLGTETVVATVKNNSSTTISTAFNLYYEVNGTVSSPISVPTPIAAGATVNVDLSIDMSTDNLYEIRAWTVLTGDEDHDNDTNYTYTANTLPYEIPFTIAFDPNTFDFLGWNTGDLNNDNSTWGVYNVSTIGGGHNDDYAALYQYSASNAGNDYYYSNCIDLEPGDYTLRFWTRVMDNNGTPYEEKLTVFIGQGQAPMTQELVDLGTITNTEWVETVTNFSITTSGTYNLGFFAYSDPDQYLLLIDDVSIDVADGINNSISEQISIYPNPASDLLNINTDLNSEISIYSIAGQLVYRTKTVNTSTVINLDAFNSGNYIIKIQNINEIVTQKLVVE
ncbi:MAG: T9SS type A sorting domain-containing protein [Bacteroidales bacterium]|nr:T9SS type A sorting domain-containing protein [Bacteroidales bacterium]